MRTTISKRLIGIGVLTTIAIVAILIMCFYSILKDQIISELKEYVSILELNESFIVENSENESLQQSGIRITLIGQDGNVIYESKAVKEMENHSDRPEFREALKEGESVIVRDSETIGEKTIYYAKLLEDGNVLRVSDKIESVWSVLSKLIPYIIVVLAAFIFISVTFSYYFTNQIIKPINQMAENMDNMHKTASYDELKPFAKKITSQNAMRREFTSNVSHELKTPLTSISGYAQLIEGGIAKTEDVQNFANKINKESKRLLGLINDIMKLSMLEEGHTEVQMEDVNLLEVANGCKKNLELKAQEKNIAFSVVGDDAYIKGYSTMVEELIYNLCDNAIRYNDENGIVVVSIYKLADKNVLSVKDNGIGIPKEHQEHIFERFYRVDKSHSKATGGTGLGLSIVKHIAIYHNAEIILESNENEGTEIIVKFNAK